MSQRIEEETKKLHDLIESRIREEYAQKMERDLLNQEQSRRSEIMSRRTMV